MKWFAVLVLLAGCGPLDVVVADVPGTDGGMMMMGKPCSGNQDCRERDYCDKSACAAPVGRCKPQPVFCDPAPQPVCGCSGVTYWNDCLRRASGDSSKTDGECTDTAQRCTGPGTCGLGKSCAVLLPESASCGGAAVEGECWALPNSCPSGPNNAGAWISCGGGQCTDVCQAIRSQQPHRRASVCP